MTRLLILLVRAYQLLLSPFLGGQCRFIPSCSAYSIECLERFGPWRGSWLTLKRLGRCHPFARAGYDPPPGAPEATHPHPHHPHSAQCKSAH